jgi:DNA-binding NarL/FixJ family response regulator
MNVVDPGLELETNDPATTVERSSRSVEETRTQDRLLVVHEHGVLREALSSLVGRDEASSCAGATTLDPAHSALPEALVVDLVMSWESGMAVLRQNRFSNAGLATLALTPRIARRETVELLELGVRGVVPEDAPPEALLRGIRAVAAGRYWLKDCEYDDLQSALGSLVEAEAASPAPRNFGLTKRELEIVAVVLRGYTNEEVAEKLSISRETVKHHLTNIFDKLGVYSRLELALFAVHHKLIPAAGQAHSKPAAQPHGC